MTDLPAKDLDKERLVQAITKLADEANLTYPDVARFIEARKESLGAGKGMGIGPGYEPDKSVSNTPQSSQSNIARTVDSKPEMLNRVRPEYTEEARNNKVSGDVLVRVLIGEDGTVKTANVIRGLPGGLNEKAVEAARKTKFKPAMKDGKPVAYSMVLRITFDIY
ncbi:MAG TPA: energy transducer TonB [Blastocatellia bacterium]|nr:energy transducer TonB [Blastocatellia bacterium]